MTCSGINNDAAARFMLLDEPSSTATDYDFNDNGKIGNVEAGFVMRGRGMLENEGGSRMSHCEMNQAIDDWKSEVDGSDGSEADGCVSTEELQAWMDENPLEGADDGDGCDCACHDETPVDETPVDETPTDDGDCGCDGSDDAADEPRSGANTDGKYDAATYDTNNDGVISLSELRAGMEATGAYEGKTTVDQARDTAAVYDEYDTSGCECDGSDGSMSADEFQAYLDSQMENVDPASYDTDSDGKLDATEMEALLRDIGVIKSDMSDSEVADVLAKATEMAAGEDGEVTTDEAGTWIDNGCKLEPDPADPADPATYDEDGDGCLNTEELQAFLEGNGLIAADATDAEKSTAIADFTALADANDDGSISLEEAASALTAHSGAVAGDADQDGEISIEEWTQIAEDNGITVPTNTGEKLELLTKMNDKADADNDGTTTVAELSGFLNGLAAADTDGTEGLSQEELDAFLTAAE